MISQGIRTDEIIRLAREGTGFNDLGDLSFLSGMNALIASINGEVQFAAGGEAAMTQRFVRIVENRLRFTADLALHPEILNEPLSSPVVILGLPRVGSTKLQRMLGSSGSFQSPLFWQVFNPARISINPNKGEEDPRIGEARQYISWRNSTNPAANAAHHIAVNEVEEETFLLEFSFETIYPMTFMNAERYYEWIQTRDQSETYAYLGKLLQYLQWQFYRGNPKPWILKSPPNLGREQQILKFGADSRFIMSHRDPVTIVASVAALIKQSRQLYCRNIDAHGIGRWCLREFSGAVRRHMEWRRDNPDIPVLDVAYTEVERNPVDVVRRSYDFLRLPLTDDVRAAIAGWLAADNHGKEMRHEYSLETCGLTSNEIRHAFDDYIRTFRDFLN